MRTVLIALAVMLCCSAQLQTPSNRTVGTLPMVSQASLESDVPPMEWTFTETVPDTWMLTSVSVGGIVVDSTDTSGDSFSNNNMTLTVTAANDVLHAEWPSEVIPGQVVTITVDTARRPNETRAAWVRRHRDNIISTLHDFPSNQPGS